MSTDEADALREQQRQFRKEIASALALGSSLPQSIVHMLYATIDVQYKMLPHCDQPGYPHTSDLIKQQTLLTIRALKHTVLTFEQLRKMLGQVVGYVEDIGAEFARLAETGPTVTRAEAHDALLALLGELTQMRADDRGDERTGPFSDAQRLTRIVFKLVEILDRYVDPEAAK